MSTRQFFWPVAGSVTATSGPLQFNKNGAATTVSQDTVTPSNSVPLPTALYNTAGPLNLTTDGNGLKVSNANVDIFGAGVSVQQFNQVQVSFDTAPGATLITNTLTSTGSNSIANGHALYSTGTGVTSSAKAVSVQINYYKPLYQSYAAFTAAFTTPTSANSYQRLGLYDASNGFFVGFSGLNFGVTTRSSGSDTFVNRTSFNGDLLTGAATSKFTRNGAPEAINLNYSNLFRIRFAWLGSAPILFEVYSPDGAWVVFHTIRMPNLQLNPSISNPDLPMTLDVAKASADATNLIVYTACWAAGANSNLSQITSTITDTTLAPLNRSVITGVTTGGGGGYVNVKVNPSGALVADVTGTVAVTSAALTSIDTKTPALVSGAVPSLMKVVKKDATVVTPYGTENNAVAVGNFLQKFRDSFIAAQPDLTVWDQSWTNQGSGFVAAGGNSSGSSYMKVSMCPVTANSEYVLLSKQTYKFPTRYAYGLSLSQRIVGQEIEFSLVGVNTSNVVETIAAPADLALPATITVSSNVSWAITFAVNHGLTGGDRVSLFGNTDSRLNYSALPVAVVNEKSITIANGSLVSGTYTANGFLRVDDPVQFASNAIAFLAEGSNATLGNYVARRNGTDFRTSSVTTITSNGSQANTSGNTDAWVPQAENEIISTMEEMFFSSRPIDTISNTSATSARYTNGIPDEEKEYKIRVRVKNSVSLTVPIAKLVTISKSGSGIATVTTDVAHNLTTSDYIQITGVRDRTNYPNLTAQASVLSVISPTQFTCLIGSASTTSSTGGSVYKVQGSQLAPGYFDNSISSISRSGNILIVVTNTTINNMLAGETISLHGCDATSMGLYDGPYKVLRAQASIAYLESVGADFASINCGGSLIKRTDARLHFIRMADYTRNAVEISNARGIVDTSRAMAVNVANAVAISSGTVSNVNLVTASNTASSGFVTDVSSSALTTTTTTAAITPAFGCSMSFSIPVTAVTGTSPTLDVSIEVAEDSGGTLFYKVYDFPRITTTGVYRSPVLPYNGSRVRYVQTVGGGTPSFTRILNRYQSSIQAPILTQFIDRTIVLTTLNSVTPTYFCDGCTIFNVNVTATTVTTPPVLALEGSDDGVKFYVITTEIQTVANVATTMSVSGFSPRFVRVRVVTAGVSATLDNIVIKGVTNSTPKSSSSGRNRVAQLFNDYTSTSVTTAAYVQLTAATTANINKLEIFDSSGETLILAVGAAASEVDQFYILPGGNGPVDLFIPAGSRIAIKSKTATASSGLIAVNLYS